MEIKIKISVIVLVGGKYNKKLLQKCLDSVNWADEVIKVETDKLKGGFADWRNYGAKKARGEWLFYVDSDEQVSSDLKIEILKLIGKLKIENCAFAIPRNNILLGKRMRWGGWWPDYVLRLIKRDALDKWEGELHEQPKIECPSRGARAEIGKLKEPLLHNSHRTLSEMVDKTNEWSEIEAKLLFAANHPKMNLVRFFSAGFREFWYRGIRKLGFLDGTIGVIEVIYQTYSRLVTYAKLWELQIKHARRNI